LEKSSKKSLVRIIKKILFEKKKGWDSKLKYVLWVDKISTNISIETSPFQLVYGILAWITSYESFVGRIERT
jgi:hypothetical protein